MKRFLFRFLPVILMLTTLVVAGTAIWSDLQKSTPKGIADTAQAEAYPSALCTNGTTVIVKTGTANITLRAGEKYPLMIGDVVKTLTEASAATIFWSEGSVTRLGGKTSLEINETGTKDQRKVDFSILNGKTYSRIFEYLRSDEYFQERYDSGRRIASVRGTAFEINTDSWYVMSLDHTVELSDVEKKISAFLSEGKAVALSDSTREISKKFIDSAWEKLNSEQDREALAEYVKKLSERFGNLSAAFGSGSGQLLSASGSALHFSFDPSRFASGALSLEQTSAIKDFYYKAGGLDISQEAKNSIRSYLIANSTGSVQTDLEGDFARHSLYDIMAAQKAGNTQAIKDIQEVMKQYKVDETTQKSLDAIKKSLNLNLSSEQKAVLLQKLNTVNDKAEAVKETIQKQAEKAADSIFNALSQ